VQPDATRSRGSRLGLPEQGSGSLATINKRVGAFVVDCVASGLIAGLFTSTIARAGGVHGLPGSWSLLPLLLDYVIGLPLAGRTLGMNLFGIRVVRVDRRTRVTPLDALVRTVLLFLLIPALIWDKDGRGLNDRVARTAVVQA
jgi:uncharacterized RDD family membrane protein YckC